MRLVTIKNKTARLPEKDYQQLLKRFSPEKAKNNHYINIKCICDRYQTGTNCGKCPFTIFQSWRPHILGCEVVLEELGLEPTFLELGIESINWWDIDDEEAKKEIQAIRDWLLSLPKERKHE